MYRPQSRPVPAAHKVRLARGKPDASLLGILCPSRRLPEHLEHVLATNAQRARASPGGISSGSGETTRAECAAMPLLPLYLSGAHRSPHHLAAPRRGESARPRTPIAARSDCSLAEGHCLPLVADDLAAELHVPPNDRPPSAGSFGRGGDRRVAASSFVPPTNSHRASAGRSSARASGAPPTAAHRCRCAPPPRRAWQTSWQPRRLRPPHPWA